MTTNEELAGQLEAAIRHIDHMAAWIGKQNKGYSFESLGEDMPAIKDTLAALRTPAPAPVGGDVVEALRQARDDLLAVGNDYPGSSCQKWCTERAKAAWDTLRPWEHCPSTHCERTQECRSVNECSANKSTVAALQAQPSPAQGDDVVERVGYALWVHEVEHAAPNIVKYRTLEQYREGIRCGDLLVWQGIARAALAAMQQVPVADDVRERLLALSSEIGPHTLEVGRSEDYSGEHREWVEAIRIPKGHKLFADVLQQAADALNLSTQPQESEIRR